MSIANIPMVVGNHSRDRIWQLHEGIHVFAFMREII